MNPRLDRGRRDRRRTVGRASPIGDVTGRSPAQPTGVARLAWIPEACQRWIGRSASGAREIGAGPDGQGGVREPGKRIHGRGPTRGPGSDPGPGGRRPRTRRVRGQGAARGPGAVREIRGRLKGQGRVEGLGRSHRPPVVSRSRVVPGAAGGTRGGDRTGDRAPPGASVCRDRRLRRRSAVGQAGVDRWVTSLPGDVQGRHVGYSHRRARHFPSLIR